MSPAWWGSFLLLKLASKHIDPTIDKMAKICYTIIIDLQLENSTNFTLQPGHNAQKGATMSKRIKKQMSVAQSTKKPTSPAQSKKTKTNTGKLKSYLGLAIALLLTAIALAIFWPEETDSRVARSEEVRKLWFKSMNAIIDKTQDDTAKQVSSFIENNYALAIPEKMYGSSISYQMYREGKQIKGNKLPKNYFLLVIVWPGDTKPVLDRSLDNYTVYSPPRRAIFISSDRTEMSPTNVAFTLLHEGFHAMDDALSGYRPNRNWEDMIENERQCYLFETALLVRYLGPEASNITFNMAQQITINLQWNGNKMSVSVNDQCNPLMFKSQVGRLAWSDIKDDELNHLSAMLKLYAHLHKIESQYQNLNPHDLATLQREVVARWNKVKINLAPISN